MKRITVAVDDDVHAGLKTMAKADGRVLLEYLKRLLTSHARKATK